ncbi:hypothetical protein J6590_047609 [Homalodisca vitripennis]|nr:hypothetical protein J6590_047609 [Homalodisca vitripennis]
MLASNVFDDKELDTRGTIVGTAYSITDQVTNYWETRATANKSGVRQSVCHDRRVDVAKDKQRGLPRTGSALAKLSPSTSTTLHVNSESQFLGAKVLQ